MLVFDTERASIQLSYIGLSLSAISETPNTYTDETNVLTFANVRSAPTVLMDYLARTDFWHVHGNSALAKLIATSKDSLPLSPGTNMLVPNEPLTLFHRWKPGMICVSARFLSRNEPNTSPDMIAAEAIRKTGWLVEDQLNINLLVDLTPTNFHAIQNRNELGMFLHFLELRTLRVIVEIGTVRGGLFDCISQIAASDVLLVSIDFPGSRYGRGQTSVTVAATGPPHSFSQALFIT